LPIWVDYVAFIGALLLLAGCERAPVLREEPEGWERAWRPALEVELTEADGTPIPGGWVTLSPGGRDAPTDADGLAVFPMIEPDDYEVLGVARGFSAASGTATVETSDVSVMLALEPLDTTAALHGTVLDPYDSAVEGVTVEVDGVAVAVTAADGTYAVTGLDEGSVDVVFRAPADTTLLDWDARSVPLVGGRDVQVTVELPARAPDGDRYIGSPYCILCHGKDEPGTIAAAYQASAHYRAARSPEQMAGDASGIDGDFASGLVVSLSPVVPGATVTLSETSATAWWARVTDDDGTSTGDLPVVEVYGGHHAGAAVAVEIGSGLALLPVAWAAPGRGLSTQQLPAQWLPAWTDGWFDGDGKLALEGGEPGAAANWDLQCAGCHATGQRLVESDGFTLEPTDPRGTVDRFVGCEACHGPGLSHLNGSMKRLSILNPGRLQGLQRIEVCARCHERVTSNAHPFSADPGWPVTATGEMPPAYGFLHEVATPDPEWWMAVDASRVQGDQVGEFRASPHRRGPEGYDGACSDCHDPHGTEHVAMLRREPSENELCTGCHRTRFPDVAALEDHSAHAVYETGPWEPGTCTGCHMPRSGKVLRLDAVSGVGELHAHGLLPWHPDDILAEFDAAGAQVLPPGEVAVPGCVDCHVQLEAQADDEGGSCGCPAWDPFDRDTYTLLSSLWDSMFGSNR